MKLAPETINKLQRDTANVRNICILAHVDHGKTSLSDSLLATNGIISQRMAGKIRFLDSREDEQLRGITMEASAISLYFNIMRRKQGTEEVELKEHLINLIDSPGHIDFSSEVSTASRLCDGAVVLVDSVEGVCSQTVNVLRQCWVDNLKPLLVINKLDRLVTEWQLSPLEAYQHISRIIEQVNSVIGSFFAGDRMEDDLKWREAGSQGEYVERSDSDLYFAPEKNNVIFASAIDGWAFSINTFSKIYSAKLGFSRAVLAKTLWGDYYLDMKNKKIIPGSKLKSSQSNLKPLFVTLILDQIWSIYDSIVIARDDSKIEKIIAKLGAKIPPRDMRSKDNKNLLNVLMSQWIPLSHALLGAVIEYLPNPQKAQQERIEGILKECLYSAVAVGEESVDEDLLIEPEFKSAMINCDASDPEDHTFAYVSKMISVPERELPKEVVAELSSADVQEKQRLARERARKADAEIAAAMAATKLSGDDDDIYLETRPDQFEWEFEEDEDDEDEEEAENEVLVAFTRVYSGELSKGQCVCIVGPKYDPSLPKKHPTNIEQLVEDIEIEDLLLIMGREFVRVDSVPAGNLVGVVGLGDIILKNATIMSEVPEEKPYINMASTSTLIHNKPIMKVTIEPQNPLKLFKLEKGLDLLSKADPVLEWYVDDDSGELIVCVAGELHLERCLKDLEKRFAPGCEVTIKEPVIPFREGLANESTSTQAQVVVNTDDTEVSKDEVEVQLEVYPMPTEVTAFLIKSEVEISELIAQRLKHPDERPSKQLLEFQNELKKLFKEHSSEQKFVEAFGSTDSLVDSIVSFGPRRIGPNVLVESPLNNQQFRRVFSTEVTTRFVFESNVLNGYQLAMNEGPLAAEPVQGTLVVLRKTYRQETEELLLNLSSRVLKMTKQLIHAAFLKNSPRLFLAMYTCEIQASPDVIGKVYAVVQKRGGLIISEELKEGTPFFTITARIPVVEAFGFTEEMRKRTSGAASPQLIFDGFDMLDIDPFWVPHTEEELEELGIYEERENVGRKYMNAIRRRKGLFVDEKVVKNAEKQRTLKKD